jgi:inhibitor of cysteine peptidase
MLKIWRLTLLIGLFFLYTARAAEETPLPASPMVTASNDPYTDASRAITVTADNPEFSIRLKSNPTTGYRWYLKAWPNNWLKVIGLNYSANNTALVGSGGEEVWHFKVLPKAFSARMLMSIEFVSIQPWNMQKVNESASQTFYVVTDAKE